MCGSCSKFDETKSYGNMQIMPEDRSSLSQEVLDTAAKCNCISNYEWDPVCGNDGLTYPNPSIMMCIKKCTRKGTPIRSIINFGKLQFANEIIYYNKKKFHTDLKIKSCGSCSAVATIPPKLSKKQATSRLSESFRRCLDNCPVLLRSNTICGSDGYTYDSFSEVKCYNSCTNRSK